LVRVPNYTCDRTRGYRFSGLPPGRYHALSSVDFDPAQHRGDEKARADEAALKESSDTSHDLRLFVAP